MSALNRAVIPAIVVLGSCGTGALIWLGLIWIAPSSWAPRGWHMPLISSLIGIYWTESLLPSIAKAWPGRVISAIDEFGPRARLAVYGLVLTIGGAVSLIRH